MGTRDRSPMEAVRQAPGERFAVNAWMEDFLVKRRCALSFVFNKVSDGKGKPERQNPGPQVTPSL